jgi:triacylglycerol lipase
MISKEFSLGNGELFSRLSRDAYLNPSEFCNLYDAYDIKFISHGTTQCYVLWDADDLIYVFRGTEPTKFEDIAADVKFFKTETDSGNGKVHSGFKGALDLVWDDLVHQHDYVSKNHEIKNMYFTGHSLGAALATLAAARFNDEASVVYTYGSPRVGNRKFLKSFKPTAYRFRNHNDIVTRHPLELVGFTHVGHLKYFNGEGELKEGFSRIYMIYQWVTGIVSGFMKFEIDSFSDHSSVKYNYLCNCAMFWAKKEKAREERKGSPVK